MCKIFYKGNRDNKIVGMFGNLFIHANMADREHNKPSKYSIYVIEERIFVTDILLYT
jgi:hypothetical protein